MELLEIRRKSYIECRGESDQELVAAAAEAFHGILGFSRRPC